MYSVESRGYPCEESSADKSVNSGRTKQFLRCFTGTPTRIFITIFALSIAIRLASLAFLPKAQVWSEEEAERIALTLARTGHFANPYRIPTGPTAHTTPFYPFLLAGIFRLFGRTLTAYYARCVLLIVTISSVYGLLPTVASRLGFRKEVGITAGLVSAVLVSRLSGEIWRAWDEPFAALALLLLVLLTLDEWKRQSWTLPMAALAGLLWGMSLYVSAILLAVVVGLSAIEFAVLATSARRGRVARYVAVKLLIVVLVMMPWIIRNRLQLGAWIFMRSNLGIEMNVSNNDDARPIQQEHFKESLLRRHPNKNPEENYRVAALGEVQYNRMALHEAVAWIKAHPWSFCKLTAERAFYFWLPPLDVSQDRYMVLSLKHRSLLWIQMAFKTVHNLMIWAVTLLGFWGLRLLYKCADRKPFWLIATVWMTYPCIYYLVQVVVRYRTTIDWTVTLMASFCIWELWSKLAKKSPAGAYSMPTSDGSSRDE